METAEDIDPEALKSSRTVGVTAGASTPEFIIRSVYAGISLNNRTTIFMKEFVPNVLAERYAFGHDQLWSASGKVVLEREFWIAVMRAQRTGEIDQSAIDSSEKVKLRVDLDSIRKLPKK